MACKMMLLFGDEAAKRRAVLAFKEPNLGEGLGYVKKGDPQF